MRLYLLLLHQVLQDLVDLLVIGTGEGRLYRVPVIDTDEVGLAQPT